MVFRIIATVFIGISFITAFFKNVLFFDRTTTQTKNVIIWTGYGWLWRTFCIIAIWII